MQLEWDGILLSVSFWLTQPLAFIMVSPMLNQFCYHIDRC
jgi:hypothetical protein